jgi:glycosyltransferase involved in cell wall biosynthesis
MPSVVIPVLNEAPAIGGLLAAMPEGYRAVVVDNGSTDGSGDIARAAGASVIVERARGFGAACWAGLVAADSPDGVVCFMDGDGSLDPGDLPLVAAPVLDDRSDIVLGARRPVSAGAWPVHARVANRVLVHGIRVRTGLRLRDLGPMHAARARDLLRLGIVDLGSGGLWRWSFGLPPPAGASTRCLFRTPPGRGGRRSPARWRARGGRSVT